MSHFVKTYSLFCDCGMWVGYCLDKKDAMKMAVRDGWKRLRGRGWTCPYCQGKSTT